MNLSRLAPIVALSLASLTAVGCAASADEEQAPVEVTADSAHVDPNMLSADWVRVTCYGGVMDGDVWDCSWAREECYVGGEKECRAGGGMPRYSYPSAD